MTYKPAPAAPDVAGMVKRLEGLPWPKLSYPDEAEMRDLGYAALPLLQELPALLTAAALKRKRTTAPAAPDVASMVKELTAQRIADGANETGLLGRAAALLARLGEGAPLSADYIQTVPDKCDRIIWRGRYYHLPLAPGASDE